ncbi:tetratricopeptide repeat protein [Aestuariivirga sp.]|uniref:tetratricopeptide repeat protein n=1 Tax=Aestuariivirga sp. TaxID=2650926 RepID=UPI0039E5B610
MPKTFITIRKNALRRAAFSSAAALALMVAVSACSDPRQRAEAYYKSGNEYLAKNEVQKAAIEFRSALKLDENYADAWYGMAQVEEASKNWPRVVGDLRKTLDLDPKHLQARIALSKVLLVAGNYKDAMDQINLATAQAPDDPDVLALKATSLLKMGDRDGAVATAKILQAKKPGSEEALLILAAARREVQDIPGALAIVTDGLKANPKSVGLSLFRIELLETMKDSAGEEKAINELIAAYPNEPIYRKGLVAFYMNAKRPDDAEAALRGISAIKPDDVQAKLDVVSFLVNSKGAEAGIAELTKLIAADPKNAIFRISMAELQFQMGQKDQSIDLLKQVIADKGVTPDGLMARVNLAGKLFTLKRLDEADALTKEILDNDSHNTGGLQLRSMIKAQRGDAEGAILDLREALNNASQDAGLKRQLAALYERTGAIELADQEYTSALKILSYRPDAVMEYVAFLGRHGKPDKAEDVLTTASAANPQNIDILKALASFKLQKQDWAGAEKIAAQLAQLGEKATVTDQILGASKAGQNQLSDSVELLRNAQSQAPTEAQPLYMLARTLVAAGKTDEAEALARSAITANAANIPARIILASVLMTQKKPADAEAVLKDGVAAAPDNPLAHRSLADMVGAQGRLADAVAILKDASAKFPNDIETRVDYASWMERNGDIDGAIAEFDSLYKLRPDSMMIANNLASLLTDHRSDKASLDRAVDAAQILRSSPVPQFQDTLGWALFRSGDVQGAIPLLEQAIAKLDGVPEVNYHLGATYAAAGRKDDAAKYLQKALSLSKTPALTELIKTAMTQAGVQAQ